MPRRLEPFDYPEHFLRRKISKDGWMRWRKRLYFVSSTLHHQAVGLEPQGEGIFSLYFGPICLGRSTKSSV